jgi:hypothetical protein
MKPVLLLSMLALPSCAAFCHGAGPTLRCTGRMPISLFAAEVAATPDVSLDEKQPRVGVRQRLLGMPTGIWRRCNEYACTVGPPRPLQLLRNLIPRRRPLVRLGNNECSIGIYKVMRREGVRHMVLFPLPRAQEECTMDNAMDLM